MAEFCGDFQQWPLVGVLAGIGVGPFVETARARPTSFSRTASRSPNRPPAARSISSGFGSGSGIL